MTDGFGFDDRTADAAVGDTPSERVVARLKKLNADPVRFDFGDEDVVRFVDRQWERVFGDGDAPRTTTFETFRPRVTRDDAVLDGPVGAGAPNHPLDGFRAKKLLNRAAGFPFRPGEEDFGEVGPRVVSAIKRFQAERGLTPDGVIQPEGPTVQMLGRDALERADRRALPFTAERRLTEGQRPSSLITGGSPPSRPIVPSQNARAQQIAGRDGSVLVPVPPRPGVTQRQAETDSMSILESQRDQFIEMSRRDEGDGSVSQGPSAKARFGDFKKRSVADTITAFRKSQAEKAATEGQISESKADLLTRAIFSANPWHRAQAVAYLRRIEILNPGAIDRLRRNRPGFDCRSCASLEPC